MSLLLYNSKNKHLLMIVIEMPYNEQNIAKYLQALYHLRQEERQADDEQFMYTSETALLIRQIVTILIKEQTAGIEQIYCELKRLPIDVVDKNWLSDYARDPLLKDIRKLLYIMEELHLVQSKRVKINNNFSFYWKYSYDSFISLLKRYNLL